MPLKEQSTLTEEHRAGDGACAGVLGVVSDESAELVGLEKWISG